MIPDSLSIGSLLSATDVQFISLYQKLKFENCTQERFVSEFKNKQEIAQRDAAELQQLGITPKEIGEKIDKIIEKANETYQSHIKAKPITPLSSNFKNPIVEVNEDGSFKVSGFDLSEMYYNNCSLCGGKVFKRAIYQIENLQTHEQIALPELTVHLIKNHEYFSKPGNYRIDPSRVCRVLELVK